MKIIIKANFNTDRDYGIDGYKYSYSTVCEDIDINLSDRKFKIYTRENNQHPFDDEYTFIKVFECEDEDYCKMYARSYLEKLLCNIRVGFTHYYLIEDFYKMFDKAIKSIGHEEYFYDGISGNYDGTDLEIRTIKE